MAKLHILEWAAYDHPDVSPEGHDCTSAAVALNNAFTGRNDKPPCSCNEEGWRLVRLWQTAVRYGRLTYMGGGWFRLAGYDLSLRRSEVWDILIGESEAKTLKAL